MKIRMIALGALAAALGPAICQGAMRATPAAGARTGSGVAFAAQFSVGFLGGEGNEHVYDYETDDGSRRQLSRLDWDLKKVAMGGGSLSVRPMDKLTLNGGYWMALTEGNGEMDDYDWLEPLNPDWTHYSLSEVDVTDGYALDLNAAWDLLRRDGFVARAHVGYKQDGWKWEDRGVYLLYPEYGYVPYPLLGQNLIDYEQEFRMPYAGGSAEWASGGFSVAGYVNWSPIVAADDWDDHKARSLRFHETFEGGDMLGAGVELRYEFGQGAFKGLFLTAAADYQQIDLIIGDMEIEDYATGNRGVKKDAAGIENEYLAISLGGGVKF